MPIKDSRSQQRSRILKAGKVLLTGGWGSHECIIKNISSSGAKVETDPLFDFPSQFDLLIIQDELLVPCRLIWRQGKFAGLHFVKPMKQINLRDYRF